ncbi:MAG TPA: sulfatase-like hydrolase/transferase [Verrucomicrobiota bacterium]|nr:sulfatase-like hydrolase/transferase [Verrucomicrobiota bacterium]HNU50459.1 sulfatase-like hydrolase/transferase [Verrucomicrobiota bacterium]
MLNSANTTSRRAPKTPLPASARFLQSLALGFLALIGSSALLSGAERPNILWLVSEDNHTFLGCYGDPLARTPTLDRLAREGLLFERCFAQPVCAPSRFTLITGMYAAGHGPAHHMRAQGKIPPWLKGFPVFLSEAGYYTSNNAKTDYNAPIDPAATWNESSRTAHWRRRPSPETPFFSVFNHEVTHESCLFPTNSRPRDFTPTDPAKVRIPPYQPDTPEMRADWARYYDCIALMDGQIAAKLKDLDEAGLAQDTIVFYYSDNGGVLPRSKRFLQKSGTHVPLLVYFPPKWRHLAPAPPGSRIKDPVSFVDFAPTVLSLAGVPIPDTMQGRAFLGPARTSSRPCVFVTRDRMDERYDMMRSIADDRWLYIRNYRPDLPYVQPLEYMFQARGYQSWARLAREGRLTPATAQFWGEKPTEELYDLETDPDSVHNLAASATHRPTLERMRAALKQRILDIKDNGFLPEGSALEGYDASHRPDAYPVERVVDLANRASERNAANLPRLIEALEDPCEPVRWWAAQGCTMLGQHAAAAETALRRRLDDPSGAVQVAAAEALARLKALDSALPTLERWLTHTASPPFALQAANVLDRLGEHARPALPTMRRVLDQADDAKNNAHPLHYPARILRHTVAVLDGATQALVYPQPAQSASQRPAAQPNIVFVLADDFGWGDPGSYGGALVPTPCLDRMAREGIRFTQYYAAAPICSPSRAGCTTGMFPARWRLTSYLQTRKGNADCGQADSLDPQAPSLARLLQSAGYATAHIGKWHMGGGRDVTNAPSIRRYGFDEYVSTWESPDPHPDLTATNWIWSAHDTVKRWDRTGFFVDQTLDFLRRHASQPCYVNLWPDDTHTPFVPSPAMKRKHAARDNPNGERNFKGVLDDFDRQMGRLLDGLERLGQTRPTLVLFTGDNGPLPTYSHQRTGGLRGSKLSLYEGGIRQPLIAWWPGHAPQNQVNEQTVIAATDLLPSLAAIAGAQVPESLATTLDGEDLSAAFRGGAPRRTKPLFWEYGRNPRSFAYPTVAGDRSPNLAVREDRWKLLVNADGSGPELYDLLADPRETRSLTTQEPELTSRLSKKALEWRTALP